MAGAAFSLVVLPNGSHSIRSEADGETFHPVAGPVAEAEALYVRQLRLRERILKHRAGALTPGGFQGGPFVIWDVGLGAAGNALSALRSLADLSASVRVSSFDHTLEALRFAWEHRGQLPFLTGLEGPVSELLERRQVGFRLGMLTVEWEVRVADFPALMTGPDALTFPDVIFYDAFSPARNAAMWTLPHFAALRARLDDARPCALATFSRSTMTRVALLLAGFFVGVGQSIAGKEETTVAATARALLDRPLDGRWLNRARASHSAEPLHEAAYRRAPLAPETWEQLRHHPQFTGYSGLEPSPPLRSA